jgi:hypothetical protein
VTPWKAGVALERRGDSIYSQKVSEIQNTGKYERTDSSLDAEPVARVA